MAKNNKILTAIRLAPEVKKAVQSQAKTESRSFSNMVNYILKSWIQSKMK